MKESSKRLKKFTNCWKVLKKEASSLLENLERNPSVTWATYEILLLMCSELLRFIKVVPLPPVKPRWADFTGAGPGVGVSNSGVQLRDAELARIFSSDYRVWVHRARGDSGQNEAERTNSAIGDSVVDGATIKWEHFKRFDGLSADEITKLTLEEFERMEEERMTKKCIESRKPGCCIN